jgi:hypothetical protein
MNKILNIIKGTAAIIDEKAADVKMELEKKAADVKMELEKKAADVKMELEKKAAKFIGTAAAIVVNKLPAASSAIATGSNKMNMERYVMCQRCHLRRRVRMH